MVDVYANEKQVQEVQEQVLNLLSLDSHTYQVSKSQVLENLDVVKVRE